jgi:hypothetical protein
MVVVGIVRNFAGIRTDMNQLSMLDAFSTIPHPAKTQEQTPNRTYSMNMAQMEFRRCLHMDRKEYR